MSDQYQLPGNERPADEPSKPDQECAENTSPLVDLDVGAHEGGTDVGAGVVKQSQASQTAEAEQLNTRIARLEEQTEIEFIRREVRFIPSMINLWKHFRIIGGRKDPRSLAALSSAMWRVFSPSTAAAAGGGLLLLALTGLQVLLVAAQNSKLDQQTYISEASRNTALAGDLGALIGAINEEVSKACLKKSSGKMAGTGGCWRDLKNDHDRVRWLMVWMRHPGQANEFDAGFDQGALLDMLKGDTDPRMAALPLSPQLSGRVVALTNALRPYRFLDNGEDQNPTQSYAPDRILGTLGLSSKQGSPSLLKTPQSVERGLILAALISNRIATDSNNFALADLSYAFLPNWNLEGRSLRNLNLANGYFACASFAYSYLEFSNFRGANLRDAVFVQAEASDASFVDGDLRGAVFDFAELPEASAFSRADVSEASFDGARVSDPNWVSELQQRVAKGFEAARWRLVREETKSQSYRIEWVGERRLREVQPKGCKRPRLALLRQAATLK